MKTSAFARLLLLVILVIPVSGHAAGWQTLVAAQGAMISESAAAASAQRAVKGRVLSVQLSDAGGQPVYRVKILTDDGRVRMVVVNAQTGAVMSN